MGGKGTKEWKSEWKSVIQSNLVRAKWRCAESLLSVGWQDELLVNDCPLCQKADFFFPTSDVCVSAAVFPSSVPPKYCSLFTSSRTVFPTNFYTFRLYRVPCLPQMSTQPSAAFPCRRTTAQSPIKSFGLPLAYALMNYGSLEVIPLRPTYKSAENLSSAAV